MVCLFPTWSQPKPRRDWVGRLCLRYVNWRDSRCLLTWQTMQAAQPRAVFRPAPPTLTIQSLPQAGGLATLLSIHNAAYQGACDFRKAGWLQGRAMQASLSFDPTLVWVAYDEERPVGFCMARVRNGQGYITGIGVVSRLRRRGIGTAMMQHALEALRARGVSQVSLEVAAEDQRPSLFFRHLGFQTMA